MASKKGENAGSYHGRRTVLLLGPGTGVSGGMDAVISQLAAEQDIIGYNLVRIPTYLGGGAIGKIAVFMKSVLSTLRYMPSSSCRVLHIHSSSGFSFARKSVLAMIGLAFRKKVILHMHGGGFEAYYYKSPAPLRAYIRWILSMCTVVALSESWERFFRQVCGCRDVVVIGNPVRLQKPIHRHSGRQPTIVFMGGFAGNKGSLDLAKAACSVKREKFSIVLAGSGDQSAAREILSQCGLSGRVTFAGWVTGREKDKILSGADMMILPSYNEGLPMSLIEAMSVGVPVAASRVGGIPDLLGNGSRGLLFSPGNVPEIASAIKRLVSSPSLRARLSGKARDYVSRKHDSRVIAADVRKLYGRLWE